MGQDHEAPGIPFTRPVASTLFYSSWFYHRPLRHFSGHPETGECFRKALCSIQPYPGKAGDEGVLKTEGFAGQFFRLHQHAVENDGDAKAGAAVFSTDGLTLNDKATKVDPFIGAGMPRYVLMIQAYLQLVADFKTLFGPEGQAAGLDVTELDDGLPAPTAQIRGAALMFLAVLCHGTGGLRRLTKGATKAACHAKSPIRAKSQRRRALCLLLLPDF